jgi:peptidoglycan hydrolase-like protein with peptidoglycan-binding domain
MSFSFRALEVGMDGEDVRAVQTCLKNLGYDDVGIADGKFGSQTQAAVKAYQKSIGRQDTGVVTPGTWNALAANCSDLLLPAVDGDGNPLDDEEIVIHDTVANYTFRLTEAFGVINGILGEWLQAYHAFREILHNVPVSATRPDFGKVFESQIKDVLLDGVKALIPSDVPEELTTITSKAVSLLEELANELDRARTANEQLEVNNWILNNEGRLTDIINLKMPDTQTQTIQDLTQWYTDHPDEQTELLETIQNQLSNLRKERGDHTDYFLRIASEFIKSFNGQVTIEIKAADWTNREGLIPWDPVENWTVTSARIEGLPKIDDKSSGELIADKMKEYKPSGISFDAWSITRIFYFNVGGAVEPGWITPGLSDTGFTIEYDENGSYNVKGPEFPANFPWDGWVQRLIDGLPPTPNIQ